MKRYKCPSCDTPESYSYEESSCNVEGCAYNKYLDYPEVTRGSIVAKKVREKCNNLPNIERERNLLLARALIRMGEEK